MRRRAFIAILGGAAAWPEMGFTQGPGFPVVGLLAPNPDVPRLEAFRRGLSEAGYVEGHNVIIEYRLAEGRFGRLPELAADLVRRRVNVIATPGSTVATLAAKAATTTIPIVFGIPDDPVKFGLVASLARPDGNATGVNFFTAELVAKRLQVLHELLPKATQVAVLVNPANTANAETTLEGLQQGARILGVKVRVAKASDPAEIDAAFASLAQLRPDALFVGPDSFFNSRRVQLATLAARHAIPATYAVRDYVEAGGLMSYGTSVHDMFRQVGIYTGRVLKGEDPADLPVVQSTKFELVINLSTAKALGLDIPPTLLARADEVIE